MFSKKYTFETQTTKKKRFLKNLFSGVGIFFILYTIFCFSLLIINQTEKNNAQDVFFKKSPDIIVVFTGDIGRIPFALEKAQTDFGPSKIFITGVYASNTVTDIISKYQKDNVTIIDSHQIDIDYWAQNTIGNVISTMKYLRANDGFKKILIISSDYHIARIKLIMNFIKSSHQNYEFYYYGLNSDYLQLSSIRKVYTEGYKILKSIGFFFLIAD